MKYEQTLTYGLKRSILNICPFYIGLTFLLALFFIMGKVHGRVDIGGLGSWDLLEAVVAMGIIGGFKERFHLFLQNGYSRKSLFVHYLICIVAIVLLMAALEEVINVIAPYLNTSYTSTYASLYGTDLYIIKSFLWHSGLFLATASISFLVATACYRLSKIWKIIIFGVIPMLIVFVFPMINILFFDSTLGTAIFKGIWKMLGLYYGANPYQAVLSSLCISLLASLGTYAILRKLNIQK